MYSESPQKPLSRQKRSFTESSMSIDISEGDSKDTQTTDVVAPAASMSEGTGTPTVESEPAELRHSSQRQRVERTSDSKEEQPQFNFRASDDFAMRTRFEARGISRLNFDDAGEEEDDEEVAGYAAGRGGAVSKSLTFDRFLSRREEEPFAISSVSLEPGVFRDENAAPAAPTMSCAFDEESKEEAPIFAAPVAKESPKNGGSTACKEPFTSPPSVQKSRRSSVSDSPGSDTFSACEHKHLLPTCQDSGTTQFPVISPATVSFLRLVVLDACFRICFLPAQGLDERQIQGRAV